MNKPNQTTPTTHRRSFDIDYDLLLKVTYIKDGLEIKVKDVTIQGKQIKLDEIALEMLIMDIINDEFEEAGKVLEEGFQYKAMPVRKIKQMVIDPEVKQHLWYASFRTFHYRNPQILQMILEQLDKAMEKGMTKVSIKTIIGYLRWDVTLQIKGDYEFKINDAYTSLYSELIAKNWPEYGHMFEQRIFRSIAKQNTTDGK